MRVSAVEQLFGNATVQSTNCRLPEALLAASDGLGGGKFMTWIAILLLLGGLALVLLGLVVSLIWGLSRAGGGQPRVVGCSGCGRNVLPGVAQCPNCGHSLN